MEKSILRRSKSLILFPIFLIFFTIFSTAQRIKIYRLSLIIEDGGRNITYLLPGYSYNEIPFCGIGWLEDFLKKSKFTFSLRGRKLEIIGRDKRRGIFVFKKVGRISEIKVKPTEYGCIFIPDIKNFTLLKGVLFKNVYCISYPSYIPPFLFPLLDENGNVIYFVQKKFKNERGCTGKTFEIIKKETIISSIKKIISSHNDIPMAYFGMKISTCKYGIHVDEVKKNFAADRYGIKNGDIILFVDRISTPSVEDFLDLLKNLNPHTFHTFLIQRSGKIIRINIKPDKK